MSLQDLTRADFEYYCQYATKMRTCHDREFMEQIDPDLVRNFYRGRNKKDNRFSRRGVVDEKDLLVLTQIFSSANTILPNLLYQNPAPIITAKRKTPADSAALVTALLKHYDNLNKAKPENQEAVMNSYFFGLGWKKFGYRVVYPPQEMVAGEPETQGQFQDTMRQPKQVDTMESKETAQFPESEGLFNASESPLNVMLDHKADFLNCRAILHRVPRTLYDLMVFGNYDPETLQAIYTKMKAGRGSRLDTRDIDLNLNELHISQKNGIWILSWCEEYDKPIQYEKSLWQGEGFQFEGLRFTNEPGVRYPISHMKIATQVQGKIDNMAQLFYDMISRQVNLLLLNSNALAKGQLDAVVQNKTRGIVLTNKDVNAGSFAHIQSPAVTNDLPTLIQFCQQNLTEVMGADTQLVSGKSKNDTLGQDELARVGTKIRESGMQDRVKDWLINQWKKETKLLQEFSDGQLELEITGEDYSDVVMQKQAERQQIEFMTMNNPIGAKRFIQGDYDFDTNMDDAIKPNRESQRAQLSELIIIANRPEVKMGLINTPQPKIIRTDLLVEDLFKTYDGLGNPKKYLEDIDSMQLAAMQVKEVLMGGGGQLPLPNQQPAARTTKNNVKDASSEVSNPSSKSVAA